MKKIFSDLALYLKIGARNVVKYRRRSAQMAGVVCVGAFVITAIAGFTSGFFEKYLLELLEGTAHGKIFRKGYYEKREIAPLELAVNNYRAVADEMSALAPGAQFSASISAGAVVSFGEDSLNMMVVGAEPFSGGAGEIFPIYKDYAKSVRSGRFFADDAERGVMISSYAARNLGCSVGDKVIIFTSDRYGSFAAVELPIIGVFQTGNKEKDENIVLADLASVRKLTGLGGAVTEIAVHFDEIAKADAFAASSSGALEKNGLEFVPWKELLGSYIYAFDMGKAFNFIIYLIFVIVAVVGIMNTVLISIFDRMRDIGTLRAMGFTRNDVTMMVAVEVQILGVIGAMAGVVLGGAFIYYFAVHGIPISESTRDMASGWISDNRIYPAFSFAYLVAPLVISALVPVLSAAYPLFIMRRTKIKDALGYL